MPNPWDRLPPAREGEPHFLAIFQAVGQIVTAWEYLEFKLSRIHSFCRGAPDDWAVLRSYGEPLIYSHRMQALSRAVDAYFTKKPCQELEGEMAYIRTACDGFASIRNDIVHGIVFDCGRVEHLRNVLNLTNRQPQFLLIPPMQTMKRYSGNDAGVPSYAYDSRMIGVVFSGLHTLQLRIDSFGERLFESVPTSPTWR